MTDLLAKLVEINQGENGEIGGCLEFLKPPVFTPGQYFLVQPSGEIAPCAHTVFPINRSGSGIWIAPPLPVIWQPGMEMAVSGPFGHGFHLPVAARRVALAASKGGAGRLLGILEHALAQQADVTFYLDGMPANLPAVVEVQPFSQLPAAMAWADYLAVDLPAVEFPHLTGWLGFTNGQNYPCPVEVLLRGVFPCGGLADCGVCAVKTRKGYQLACKDGPVFNLNDLELV
jgi:NAD(P)H-flavin reductase